jgi:hypothetical protein
MGKRSDFKKKTVGICNYCDYCTCKREHKLNYKCTWYKQFIKKVLGTK